MLTAIIHLMLLIISILGSIFIFLLAYNRFLKSELHTTKQEVDKYSSNVLTGVVSGLMVFFMGLLFQATQTLPSLNTASLDTLISSLLDNISVLVVTSAFILIMSFVLFTKGLKIYTQK